MGKTGVVERAARRREKCETRTSGNAEARADEILKGVGGGIRVYTEKALARKIRLEAARLPEADETAMPREAAEYLVRRQVALLVRSARLSRLQAAVLALVVEGWSLSDIARRFGIHYRKAARVYHRARIRIESGGSPWDGLYEVYRMEVRRCIYRRRRRS